MKGKKINQEMVYAKVKSYISKTLPKSVPNVWVVYSLQLKKTERKLCSMFCARHQTPFLTFFI